MPATYVFASVIYRNNHDYIIVAKKTTVPEDAKYYNFDKLRTD